VLALGVGSGALCVVEGAVVGVGVVLAGGLDGTGMVGGAVVGALLGVAVVVLGAGVGLSWVQATGPTRNPATNRAVMTRRRTVLLGWGRSVHAEQDRHSELQVLESRPAGVRVDAAVHVENAVSEETPLAVQQVGQVAEAREAALPFASALAVGAGHEVPAVTRR
jgi:hypothetical protein